MAFEGAAMWCMAQAALLAGLGLLAARLYVWRAPASAATAGTAAATVIVLATLLVPAPMPNLPTGVATKAEQGGAAFGGNGGVQRSSTRGGLVGVSWLDVRATASRMMALASADGAAVTRKRVSRRTLIAGTALAAAVIGLLRLAVAASFVARVRRGRIRIVDGSILRQFDDLQQRLGVRRRVELCESPTLSSPALVGWRRPIVLLPTERTEWSSIQLRATLAHELAHAARSDFLWRVVVRLAVALHWCQPLVHWLARRVALAQELAADRLAARVVGGPAAYARALSELALQLDDLSRLRAEPLVLPALSSQLARRIAMLRSKDGSNGRRQVDGSAAAMLIALVGAATMALRGAAEADDITPTANPGQAFHAQPIDLSFMGPVDVGRLVVRPNEFSRRAGFAPLVNLAQMFVQNQFDTEDLQGAAPPQVRIAAVDYIACSLRTVTPEDIADNPALTGTPGMSNTACEIAIRLVDPFDMQEWVATHVPNATPVEKDGLSYVTCKAGNEPNAATYLAQRDPHTVVLTWSTERLRKLTAGDAAVGAGPDAEKWSAVDGGVAALVIGGARLPRSFTVDSEQVSRFLGIGVVEGEPNPVEMAARAILESPKSIGLGLDLGPALNRISLRIKFGCADATTAQRVREGVEVFKQIAKAMVDHYSAELAVGPELLEPLDEASRGWAETYLFGLRLFADATLELRPRDQGAVDVWLEATGELPASALNAVAGVENAGIRTPVFTPADGTVKR